MISIRIESAGHVLKYRGQSWTVGRVKRRKIKGAWTEEVLEPVYCDNAWRAIVNFGCRVREADPDPREAELPILLFQILPLLRPMKPASLLLLSRRHLGLSKSKLARLSGVSRSTIQRIENQGMEHRASTFRKLMSALIEQRW